MSGFNNNIYVQCKNIHCRSNRSIIEAKGQYIAFLDALLYSVKKVDKLKDNDEFNMLKDIFEISLNTHEKNLPLRTTS